MSAPGFRRAAFLDRDGTLIVERDYLADPNDVVLVEGAAAAVARLREAGLAVVVVTNQSGMARGLYSESQYRDVAGRLDQLLERANAPVDATYHCPHHPDYTGPCECRKPGLGMYHDAADALGLDLGRSFYVGDRTKDVEPALALGGAGILVRTGYGREEEARVPEGIAVVDDLVEAAALIVESVKGRGGQGPDSVDPPSSPD